MKRNSTTLAQLVLAVVSLTIMSTGVAADEQGTSSFLTQVMGGSGCTEDSTFCVSMAVYDDLFGSEDGYSSGQLNVWADTLPEGWANCYAYSSPCARWISVSPVGATASFVSVSGENCPQGEQITMRCVNVPGNRVPSRFSIGNEKIVRSSSSYNAHSEEFEVGGAECTVEAFGLVVPIEGMYRTRTGHLTP